MDNLLVPVPLRDKLGSAASDGLLTMFADTHRLAVESFEHRLDHNTALLTERFERRLAEEVGKLRLDMVAFRADLLKWSFVFWVGQLAAIAAMLAGILGLMLLGR